MKNIILTTVVLMFSMQLSVNNRLFLKEESVAKKQVLYTAFEAPSFAPDSIKTPAPKLTGDNSSKKTVAKKKGSRKLLNKATQANQANIAKHKKLSQTGAHVEKNAVQFSFDKYDLIDNDAFNKVLHAADKLIFDNTLHVSIAGYTDNIGDEYYNDILSYKRAQQVKDYLVELGVNESQIQLSFNGTNDPAADNSDEAGRAENRRSELIIFTAS